jgi:hypothetical protein
MNTKDGVALWVLVIWVLVTGSKPLFALFNSLRVGNSLATIAWNAVVALIVAVAGIFLIRHYIVTVDDLTCHRRLEDAREREAKETRLHAKADDTAQTDMEKS